MLVQGGSFFGKAPTGARLARLAKNPSQLRVFIALASFDGSGGEFERSINEIAERAGFDVSKSSQVHRARGAVHALQESGDIEVTMRLGRRSLYRVALPTPPGRAWGGAPPRPGVRGTPPGRTWGGYKEEGEEVPSAEASLSVSEGERETVSEDRATAPAEQGELLDVGYLQRLRRIRSQLTGRHWRTLKRCLARAMGPPPHDDGLFEAFLERFGRWTRGQFRGVGNPAAYWPVVLARLREDLEGEREETKERRDQEAEAKERRAEARAAEEDARRREAAERAGLVAAFRALPASERSALVAEAWEGLTEPARRVTDRSAPLRGGFLTQRVLALVAEMGGRQAAETEMPAEVRA